jgi:hypothetical protein
LTSTGLNSLTTFFVEENMSQVATQINTTLYEFEQLAPIIYRVPEGHLRSRPISAHLIGAPGIGKTDVARQIKALLSELYGEPFGLVVCHLTTMDAPDMRGFMIPSKEVLDDGTTIATSVFTEANILHDIRMTGCARGIVLLDEFSQADVLVQKAASSLIDEGKLGIKNIPDGWWVISTSNRQKDRSGTAKPLMHNINREVRFLTASDTFSWCRWAERNGVHPLIIAWAKFAPETFFTNEVPKEPEPFCTPRSAVRVSDFLTKQVEPGSMVLPSDKLSKLFTYGTIGEGAGIMLMAFLLFANELPTIEAVERDPMTAKLPSATKNLGSSYAAMQMCVSHATAKNVNKVFKYITRLPLELQTSAAKSLMASEDAGTFLNSECLGEFVRTHKSLIVGGIGMKK